MGSDPRSQPLCLLPCHAFMAGCTILGMGIRSQLGHDPRLLTQQQVESQVPNNQLIMSSARGPHWGQESAPVWFPPGWQSVDCWSGGNHSRACCNHSIILDSASQSCPAQVFKFLVGESLFSSHEAVQPVLCSMGLKVPMEGSQRFPPRYSHAGSPVSHAQPRV